MFRQDFTCPALLEDNPSRYPYGAVTRSGPPFQALPVPKTHATGLVRVRSPLLTESRLMSFPPATEMFQFAGFASLAYGFSQGYPLRGGLPHSETPGSPIARISPGLFAACYVLHRLSVPRHPPDALLMRLPTPNGKDPSGARSRKAGIRMARSRPRGARRSAANSLSLSGGTIVPPSEDTSGGTNPTAQPAAGTAPRGHTTRFFTIVINRPPGSRTGPGGQPRLHAASPSARRCLNP